MTAPITDETMIADEVVYTELEAGIYPATFIACEPFSYEDKVTGEIELRWRWAFVLDDDSIVDTLTSRNFRPGTNALKLYTGILGRAPVSGDRVGASYGKMVNIVYGTNKSGKLTVTDVHPYKAK